MIKITKHTSHPWGKCRFNFLKYYFISEYHSSVKGAIAEFLRKHGYKRELYEFTYHGIKYEGTRLSDDMRTEVKCNTK